MLTRLARFCYRRRGRVVIGWILFMFILSSIGWGAVGPAFKTDFSLPDSETKQVFDFLEDRSPTAAGFAGQIVFTAPDVTAPEVKTAMEGLFAEVAKLPGVTVRSPYEPQNAFQISQLKPNQIAFASLMLEGKELAPLQKKAEQIHDLGDKVHVPGMQIDYGGEVFYKFAMPASEALGVLAAVVILLVAFGSVLAMGLPVATALAGLFAGLAGVALMSNALSMPEFTPAMAAMIGLGVGIDYALFIVTRYREGLHAGLDPEQATVDALDTSGRAVLFAGATVVISLLGLFLAGLGFVRGLAVACVLAVLLMMAASVTLLPALLGFARHRVEVTTWRGAIGLLLPVVFAIPAIIFGIGGLALAGLAGAAVVLVASAFVPKLRAQVNVRHTHRQEDTFWYRWSRFVQRRPWPPLLIGLALLIALAIPLFSIRLGFSDTGNLPEKETARKAYDLLAEGFGPGFNGQLLVLLRNESGAALDPASVGRLVTALGSAEGVVPGRAFPVPLGPDATLITVIPTGAPQDEATTALVHHLRDDVIPATGLDAKVGGAAAINVDFSSYLGERLPIIVISVLILSFLLLMAVFRSVLVPLKAVIVNLLSIGAAYGVIVAMFQWGWLKAIIGLDHPGPIDSWVPMMMFAIVFGLSMDYEVFLLSRMKEEYDRTGDNASAVADGLAITARVITAAALIMFCVFASFVLGEDRQLKLFGLGLAIAVILDATVVRMVLVPATMELLGDRNWWLPNWLDKVLPRIHVEGHASVDTVAPREPEPVHSEA